MKAERVRTANTQAHRHTDIRWNRLSINANVCAFSSKCLFDRFWLVQAISIRKSFHKSIVVVLVFGEPTIYYLCCIHCVRFFLLFFSRSFTCSLFLWMKLRQNFFHICSLYLTHTHNIETRNLIVYIYIMVFDVQVQWNSDFVAQINRRKKHFDYNWTINTCHSNWIFFIKF